MYRHRSLYKPVFYKVIDRIGLLIREFKALVKPKAEFFANQKYNDMGKQCVDYVHFEASISTKLFALTKYCFPSIVTDIVAEYVEA